MIKKKMWTVVLVFLMFLQYLPFGVFAKESAFDEVSLKKSGFTLVKKQYFEDKKETAYYFKHNKSGANVFYLDDGKDEKTFSRGFKTPPKDNKGEKGLKLSDWKKIREEILDTKVEDIKNYADFIDTIIAQKSVYAIADTKMVENTSFPFECTVDSSSLTITPAGK